MNIKRKVQKFVAIICALVMIVTGLTISPSKAIAAEGYTTCTLDKNVSVGSWNYYIGSWAGASANYVGGEELDYFSLEILTNNYKEWGVQVYTYNIPVTAEIEYEYSITLNSNIAGASVLLKEDSGIGDLQTKTLVEGDNVFEGTFTANDDAVKMFFKFDNLVPGTIATITSFSIKEVGIGEKPADVKAYNFYASDLGYRIDFEELEDAVSYNVYVDDSSVVANISGSGDYVEASALADYADDALHSVYLTAVDKEGNESIKSDKAKVRITTLTNSDADPIDITRIYVVTNDGVKGGADITKADKTEASLTIISGENVINTSMDSGTIKRRGNSTSIADKPAYNISFNSKKEVIEGAAKGKKWSLLANAYDKTMLRNKLAMDLGHILENVATPYEYFTDLYIDGEYKGTYLLSEPADNGRSGVNIDDSDDGIDIMFELEAERVEDDQTYYRTGLGVRLVTNEPEGLDKNTDRYKYWTSTLTDFEAALKNTTSKAVLDYIDIDSFVNMYIVNELFKTTDFGYSSVKYYITYDENKKPTIYAGTLWDFDLSSGNNKNETIRSYEGLRGQEVNTWFRYLMKNETFANAVYAKYEEMQVYIQNIYRDNEAGDSQIDQLIATIGGSKDRNYSPIEEGGAGWSESVADSAEYNVYQYSYSTVEPFCNYTYEQHVEFLREWLYNRNLWLCEKWGVEYDYEVVLPNPVSDLTYDGSEENQYCLAWQKSETAKSYNVYVNGDYVTSVTDLAINLADYSSIFENAGEYVIGVTAVNVFGESEMITTTYVVEGGPTTEYPTTLVPTTEAPTTEAPTTKEPDTTVDINSMKKPGMVTVKKATKKLAAKKMSLKIKKVTGATGYEVAVYKTKKNAKKNVKAVATTTSTKIKMTVNSKKIKNAKKLFVRVRAYVQVGDARITGKWSKVKKVTVK